MTIRNLDSLLRPRSVAVVSASGETDGYTQAVLRNLADGGFAGAVSRIDVRRHALFGIGRSSIETPVVAPELAVVRATADDLPRIVAQLGEAGTRAAILGPMAGARGTDMAKLRRAILEAARPHLMRVLGPGSGGVVVPPLGLNASVAPVGAPAGKIALITRSAAIAAAVLDRAGSHGIGFSAVLHLGDSVDIDLAPGAFLDCQHNVSDTGVDLVVRKHIPPDELAVKIDRLDYEQLEVFQRLVLLSGNDCSRDFAESQGFSV
jgi:acyl-CoA synthetase (NDP forming)